jgi:hypothetical protein
MSYQPPPETGQQTPPRWVTTGTNFDGYKVVRQLGVVRGLMIPFSPLRIFPLTPI